jgi:hypothetical protein
VKKTATKRDKQVKYFFENYIKPFQPFAENFLKITDKDAVTRKLILNDGQLRLLDAIEKQRAEGKPIRIIILKARQIGFSTLVQALIFHYLLTHFNRRAVTIGYEQVASDNLFKMYKQYYDLLPNPLKPGLEKSNQKKVTFSGLKSENVVLSAENRSSGRSFTLQALHATEVAFWSGGGGEVLLGLLQAAKKAEMIFIESTANGVGGSFYNMWQDAVAGKSDYLPVFIAWWEHSEYSTPFTTEYAKSNFIDSMSDKEKKIMARYNLTYEQMHWRRKTIASECEGDDLKFDQEYPDSMETAFISTGRPVFNMEICQDRLKRASGPYRLGYLETDAFGNIKFVDNAAGYWALYNEVVYNDGDKYRYAAGADIAEGLAQGDYTVCYIKDRKTKRIAMRFHGHMDPDLFGDELLKAQKFLKDDVYFCVESNNHGLTTIMAAYRKNVNLYTRQNFDTGYEQDTQKLGFKTSAATKPVIINQLNEKMREDEMTCDEKEFWKECLTFVRNDRGQMQAQNKDIDKATRAYDDRVMAMALTEECDKWMPSYRFEKKVDVPRWLQKREKKKQRKSFMSA